MVDRSLPPPEIRASGDMPLKDVLFNPLPHLAGKPLSRWICRLMLIALKRYVLEIRNLERIDPRHDPFILLLNHSQKIEVLAVPTLMIFHRRGKLIHFLADWNYQLVPGVRPIYRRGGVITLSHKPANPAWLNVFKPWLTDEVPAMKRARQALAERRSVGIFPEGTVNRDPARLLAGRRGAARLSMETGVPVLPVGIRFPEHPKDRPIPERAPMLVDIGSPMMPPSSSHGGKSLARTVREWHAEIMLELARLADRRWDPSAKARREREALAEAGFEGRRETVPDQTGCHDQGRFNGAESVSGTER
ncbi:MAG: 1-acyl-sn-glycerol-3-phosphate acyltransferase [Acidobacteriota bacterium]|nr:MAG: 1-acyl-sn-glycerol-3-phosphate acyltransferase [Acidobacteriota bacterium]